jgi:apolipoprotein N-acyltransferase
MQVENSTTIISRAIHSLVKLNLKPINVYVDTSGISIGLLWVFHCLDFFHIYLQWYFVVVADAIASSFSVKIYCISLLLAMELSPLWHFFNSLEKLNTSNCIVHNSMWAGIEFALLIVIGTDWNASWKFHYHNIAGNSLPC